MTSVWSEILVLEARFSVWAASRGILADGQAGFRKGHRTTVDHVITLRARVTQAKQRRKPLCCFAYLNKSFDSVPRERLWQVLAINRVERSPLQCLQSMYAQDSACVNTQDGCTEFFPCTADVKQGCQASPLLFGLYLYALEGCLVGQGPELHEALDGPSLAEQVTPALCR